MASKKVIIHDEPVVFQFIHPGKEHTCGQRLDEEKYLKLWNLVEKPGKAVTHRRKYIRSLGEYIDKNGEKKENSLDFWGEWEPDSIAKTLCPNNKYSTQDKELPDYIQYPVFLRCQDSYSTVSEDKTNINICSLKNEQLKQIQMENRKLQNTDPFVFGDCFMYSSICKPEQTLDLKPGSIILFGSTPKIMEPIEGTKKKREKETWYRVDTVFVIKDIIEANEENINKYYGSLYYDAALRFIDLHDEFIDKKGKRYHHKLFVGATVDNPINGMFSFAPCHLSTDTPFKTMRLNADVFDDDGIIHNIQSMGKSITKGEEEVKKFWRKLITYTYNQGYYPATKISEPPIFDNVDDLSTYVTNL